LGLRVPRRHGVNTAAFSEKSIRIARCFGFDLVDRFELAPVHARDLVERLRLVAGTNTLALYAQYLAVMSAIPVLRLFPSDIVVCIFRIRQRMN
jgi:hypothetical protein